MRTSTSRSKGFSSAVDDGDGERPVVAVALEHVDDAGVVDLALADADLELARGLAGVAEVDVLDVGKDAVEIDVRASGPGGSGWGRGSVPGRDGLAQLDGDLRVGGERLGMGEQGQAPSPCRMAQADQ